MYTDYNQLCKSLYNLKNSNIKKIKLIEENNIVLVKFLFNYNSENVDDIYRSSYLFIFDKYEYKLLYSYYDKVFVNNDSLNDIYFHKMKNTKMNIYELLDGINIFIFYTDRWIVINDKNKNSKMLIEDNILNNISILLNKSFQYNFLLLDSKHKNIIDYSYKFGNNYKYFYHISTKYGNKYLKLDKQPFKSIGIKYLKKLDNFDLLNNNSINYITKTRGLNIQINENNQDKNYIIENEAFKFFSLLKPNNNKYESFLRLYNINLLENHLFFYKENKYIINKKNTNEKYKTIEVLKNSYELIGKELFELFTKVWDLKDCSHKDKKLYNFLPTEYKVILYRIKGVYFKNKQTNKIPYLTYEDIVLNLKKIEYKLIIKFLVARKKVKQNMENNITDSITISFQQIYSKLDRDKLKMLAILTNYLCLNNEKKYKISTEI